MPRTERDDTDTVGALKEIPLDSIARNESNPRLTFEERAIERLASSIGEIGLLVPIKLDPEVARSMLDFALERALKAKTNVEKGVTLDIIVVCVDGTALPKIWRVPQSITQQIERLVIDASVGP